ncbi:MAG: serine hydrolase [Anaerolineaceae bacterium]|nr:serine hydrolase [Anaerolineaceae bacterium]
MAIEIDLSVYPSFKGFDDFVLKMLNEWKTPGLAVAIVKEDEVIHAKGYGYRNVTQELPMTENTLLAIGSSSKSFTSASVALLVDRGELNWDTPVRDYIPDFKLFDPVATEHMTPRDLLCHRSGLPRHDLMWYNTSKSRKEIFDSLQYLEPNKDFRSYMQYQNLMYLTAGYLVEIITGKKWEKFVEDEIFPGLEMKRSNLSIDESQKDDDFALPYDEKDGEIIEIPFRNIDTVGPAGSINSSVLEMGNWLSMHINNGNYGDKQIISEANTKEMHYPQMVIGPGPFTMINGDFKEIGDPTYALGWFAQNYRGSKLVHHGGNIDGFSSMMSFYPNEKMGVMVLANLNSSFARDVVAWDVLDRILALEPIDWHSRHKKVKTKLKEASEKGKAHKEEKKVLDTKPSYPLKAYLGDYKHPGYGIISILENKEGLQAVFNNLEFSMKHYHFDVFEMSYELFEMELKIQFFLDVDGNISSVSVPLEPNVKNIVFERMPDSQMSDRKFLVQFAGEYILGDQTVVVVMKGDDALSVSVPNQPEMHLEPFKDLTFKIKDVPSVSIEFVISEDKVSALKIAQPGGVFEAKRK